MIRFAMLAGCCLASPLLADTFTVRSVPQTVTVFTEGAKVTRVLSVDIPAGTHTIILPDLPPELDEQLPQIEVSNASLGPISVRETALKPLLDADSEAVDAARAEVKVKQAALTIHLDKEAEIRLRSETAEAQIAFLENLSKNEGALKDVSNLTEIIALVGEQNLKSRQQILEAEKAIREYRDVREELEKELRSSKETLTSLLTADKDRTQATISVTTEVGTIAEITVSYLVPAFWEPLYDASLALSNPAQLSIKRGAIVFQESGEDWENVALTLSTLSISDGTVPSILYPDRLRIYEPEPPKVRSSINDQLTAEPVIEAPVIIEETTSSFYDGIGVSYIFPTPVSIANGADALRVALDTLTFEAEVFAQAVPLRDRTAFLMARFTNTSSDPFFESRGGGYTLDNNFVGAGEMPEIPAGAEGILAFGPIEDLRLDRVVLRRNEGDSGIINRSNTQDDEVRISIENLGAKSWPVELIDRVPVGTQQDLVITYSSNPPPDIQDMDDKRGILQWKFDLPPSSEKTISLDQNIRWPQEMILR